MFASSLPTPGGALILNGFGFALLGTGVLCVIAVGLASLTTSKPAAIIVMIAWQVVASPLIAGIGSLGSSRRAILSQAIAHFSPVHVAKAVTVRPSRWAGGPLCWWLWSGWPCSSRSAHGAPARWTPDPSDSLVVGAPFAC